MIEIVQPTKQRAFLGFGAGILAALAVSSLLGAFFVSQWDEDQPQSILEFLRDVLALDVALWPTYVVMFLTGLIIWRGLRRARLRGWRTASVLGFSLAFTASFGASIFGIGGVIIALAAWHAAYRVVATNLPP